MNLDLSEYMGAYIDGSRENLDTMDKSLLSLEQNPANLDAVEEIFRAAHTLKGMSATMGFEKIAHLTHEMENILDKLRNQQIPVTTEVIDVIFETFDVLRTLVNDSIEATDSNIDLTDISAKLTSLASGQSTGSAPQAPSSSSPKASPAAASGSSESGTMSDLAELDISAYEITGLEEAGERGQAVFLLKISLVADCLLKGPRIFMILRTLDDFECDIVKSSPEVKDLENEKFDRSFKMVFCSSRSLEEIKEGIDSISEIESVELQILDLSKDGASASASQPQAIVEKPPIVEQVEAPAPPAPQYSAPAPAAPPPQAPPAVQAPSAPAAPVAPPPAPQPSSGQGGGGIIMPPSAPDASEHFSQGFENEEDADDVKEIVEFVQLVTFNIAGEIYALEIKKVEAIINMVPITRVPKAPAHIDGVINLRGEIVPVINTRRRLSLENLEKKEAKQIIILAFEDEKVKAGFLVDSVREVIGVPETSIEPPTRVSESVEVEYLKGVGKVDNKIIILLNAHRIVFGKKKEE